MAITIGRLILTMAPDAMSMSDYHYDLPNDRIASHPIPQRDQSKLLVYNQGRIDHLKFSQLPDLLPVNTILFFNDTKVIAARFIFEKASGGTIEIFLLEPVDPHRISDALLAVGKVTWRCTIGNLKRWKDGQILKKELKDQQFLEARLIDRREGTVEFRWDAPVPFSNIVALTGQVPLPPYIKREVDNNDFERYQTVYSKISGAVAAPTAGLHFTPELLNDLRIKGIRSDYLTLHVSAGTFLPVKVNNPMNHDMHEEQVIVYRQNVENLLANDRKVVAVGTTVMRTLESLYWFGVKLIADPRAEFKIDQYYPYSEPKQVNWRLALEAVLRRFDQQGTAEIYGSSSIFIYPGYTFRLCDGLITNFHQPGSTLLLLVAAFIGQDWKQVYAEALAGEYRFLSYGDGSILWSKQLEEKIQ